jgi:hypothetical protein
VCPGEPIESDPRDLSNLRDRITHLDRETQAWLEKVRGLQELHRLGAYRVMYFVNMAPKACGGVDRFYDAGQIADEQALLEVLGAGTPAIGTAREFLHYRPSQMPAAGGHAVGNANQVKADVLFGYLSTHVLPPLVPPRD